MEPRPGNGQPNVGKVASNRFAYYVVVQWSVPGMALGGYMTREIVTSEPFTSIDAIEDVANAIVATVSVKARNADGAVLVGADVPKAQGVLLNFIPLREWYDPRPFEQSIPKSPQPA